MKVFVLFGQRKEHYDGQHAPEALACASVYDHEENPAYLQDEKRKHETMEAFEALEIVEVEVDGKQLMDILRPPTKTLKGKLEQSVVDAAECAHYYVNNPSAWRSFDQTLSDYIEKMVRALGVKKS